MRRHLSSWLATRFDVVAGARDGYEAIDLAQRLAPELILLDLMMPGLDGFQVTDRLQELGVSARVVIMTSHDADDTFVEQAFRSGAWGFVEKARLAADLVRALDHVHDGRIFLPSLWSLLAVAEAGAHAVQFHSYDRQFIARLVAGTSLRSSPHPRFVRASPNACRATGGRSAKRVRTVATMRWTRPNRSPGSCAVIVPMRIVLARGSRRSSRCASRRQRQATHASRWSARSPCRS
jgi:CheY-like chemotaxis protein